jgi:hypothetical protein
MVDGVLNRGEVQSHAELSFGKARGDGGEAEEGLCGGFFDF